MENLSNGVPLSPEQAKHIPELLESEKKGMTIENSFYGRSLFYFQKH
jgi:hypothetical protein